VKPAGARRPGAEVLGTAVGVTIREESHKVK
jgi:hypothetical protein